MTRPVRSLFALALTLATFASLAVAVMPARAQVGSRTPLKVVILGDSYSAGNGAGGTYHGPEDCYRSHSNWATRYLNTLRDRYAVTVVNRACSGGRTEHILGPREMDNELPQLPKIAVVPVPGLVDMNNPLASAALDLSGQCRSRYPDEERYEIQPLSAAFNGTATLVTFRCRRFLSPQIEAVGADTDLVLFTSGGNDLDFNGIVKQCFIVGYRDPGDCRSHVEDARTAMGGVERALGEVFRELDRRLRDDAKVALLSYPYLELDEDYALHSLLRTDTYEAGREVRGLGDTGDATQRAAVDAAPGSVVFLESVKGYFAGHEPDARALHENPDRWLHEPRVELAYSHWYHYNPEGHAAVARLLPPDAFGAGRAPVGEETSADIVFAIDTTLSMGDDIDAVKQVSRELVERVAARTRSSRFALVTYRDFPERSGDPEDFPSRVDSGFTGSADEIVAAIDAMDLGFGGDDPETVFSGLNTAIGLPWRPGVKKIVLQIGDAEPLSPEPISGLTAEAIVEAALAVDPAEVYVLDVSSEALVSPQMQAIVDGTNGDVVAATSPDEVADAITGILDEALDKPTVWAGGPYVAEVGEDITFDASGSFANAVALVSYEWDFDGDGTYDRTTTEPTTTSAYPAPFEGFMAVRVTDANGESAVGTARAVASDDGDETPATYDNCADVANHGQEDEDSDGIGDACDPEPGFPTEDDPDVVEVRLGEDPGTPGGPGAPPGPDDVLVDRLAGEDRYLTAAAVSRFGFPDGSEGALLSRGDVFADALSAGSLTEGPLLLVPSCGQEQEAAARELDRLQADRLGVLGGEQAICDTSAAALAASGRDRYRLAGEDRLATAVAIAQHQFPSGAEVVYLANAAEAPDALAAGPLTDGPILLVGAGTPPAHVLAEVQRLAPERVVALGGTAAVAQDTLLAAAAGREAARLGGADRFETAVRISEYQYPDDAEGPADVLLARADVFADALAAGPLSLGPLLLVPSCGPLPASVTDELARLRPDRLIALGGVSAICDDVLEDAAASAR